MICTTCGHSTATDSQFCSNCGTRIHRIGVAEEIYIPKYVIDYHEALTIATQIRALFFKELEATIDEEIGPNEFRKYFDQFYKSDYYKNFDLRTQQLAEEVYSIHSGPSQSVGQEVDQILDQNFYAFIDHFLVMYCNDLHQMDLPEGMLKYANATKETVDLRQMILDYMNFEKEQDKVYTDLLSIPESKIKNAVKAFLFAQSQEKIFFICDQTIFGSCREGFAMTEQALHWKSHFNPPQSVFYDDLKTIKKEAEWISINGLFFNVSKAVNFKMLKLLKKLRKLYT